MKILTDLSAELLGSIFVIIVPNFWSGPRLRPNEPWESVSSITLVDSRK